MFAEVRIEEIEEWEREVDLRALAACNDGNGSLTELFFSEDLYDIARAKHICTTCEVKQVCFEGALARREPWGVWGGELLSGGRIVFNKRPGGRPPKRPRPPVIVNELGVVDSEDSVLAEFDFGLRDFDELGPDLDHDFESVAV